MSVYLLVSLVLCYLVLIKCIFYRHRRTLEKSLKHLTSFSSSRETNGADVRALIVTAHPDDECMFFAPTIVRLVESNATVHLLCLSEGNYYNQGAQRKQELLSSCAVLGIPDSRVTIVDHKKLPDDPRAEWSVSLVSSLIVNHIRAHSFNMVLTFDGSGVSGHANHVAIHKAVSHLASTGQVPNGRHVLSPLSTPVVPLPLHHLLSVHVHQHIPNYPTRTKEPKDLLKVQNVGFRGICWQRWNKI
ncbi:N-acetylglucosaminyl-phosphatidylinositol de-N-acetylase isoform X2 [Epinephelus fuscoguttatus]|uniref:N-acetylglucosaminyl-phosphatidylinositol de-N-acetylase isoform X2 n=1 Tax=Epinephelus fuscoguttatus TaxID=293821 RepID=UPI0020D1F340|nr:N-acetylglucosaminyl-phosphatidylinositol de-N-acetylase isoform X2 [Epinephelus fuscoguttatus]